MIVNHNAEWGWATTVNRKKGNIYKEWENKHMFMNVLDLGHKGKCKCFVNVLILTLMYFFKTKKHELLQFKKGYLSMSKYLELSQKYQKYKPILRLLRIFLVK